MIHAYNEIYLDSAMQCLGDMLEYAILDLNIDPDAFFKLFIDSSYARKFEIGNVTIVAGRSGIELAKMILEETHYNIPFTNPIWREDRSNIYWAGWILAYFQWYSNLPFYEIWKYISIRKLLRLYPTYHEADLMKSVETLERMMVPPSSSNIADLRKIRGWSQSTLAKMAHMSVSQLQRLEYGERKIENLSLKTALSLSKALGVDVRDLI